MKFYDKLIATSEFAKLCGVSKQTLIHYHKIGLFKPYHINEKGYRYYSLLQYEIFQAIKVLKNIGTPLEKIKIFIKDRNADNYLSLLNNHKIEIKNQIKELQAIYNSINIETDKAEKGKHVLLHKLEAFIEEVQEENIIISNKVDDQRELLETSKEVRRMIKMVEDLKIGIYTFNGMIQKEALLCKENDFNITNVYVEVPCELDISIIKPKGKYATIYHYGFLNETKKSYVKLLKFIKDNNLKLKGNAYEVVVLGERTQVDENYLLKITILVED